jgi:hypothetical protein
MTNLSHFPKTDFAELTAKPPGHDAERRGSFRKLQVLGLHAQILPDLGSSTPKR